MKKSCVALKESVAITLSTNCDLAIECPGVHAIGSIDVRVATNFVTMMKRRFSNLDSAIPGLLAMLRRVVFAVLSRSSE